MEVYKGIIGNDIFLNANGDLLSTDNLCNQFGPKSGLDLNLNRVTL